MGARLPQSDEFASQLLADAADGLAAHRAMVGHDLAGPVLDIGAHHGAWAISALLAGAEHAICIEPARVNCAALVANLNANGLRDRVTLLRAVAWEGDAPAVEVRHPRGGNSGQYSVAFHDGHPVTDEVPGLRFTWLLTLRPWSYVKIDVEGGEWSWLRGPEDVHWLAGAAFTDLEIHPLDATGYYGPGHAIHYVDEVGAWCRDAGLRATWSARHPSRLFIAA